MTTTISRRAAAAVALAGLALCADVALAQTYRTTRPVRGVYLRPPASLTGTSGLEGNLANMANAKATDLFGYLTGSAQWYGEARAAAQAAQAAG